MTIILIYSAIVFFAIRLLFEEDSDIIVLYLLPPHTPKNLKKGCSF